MKDNNFKLQCFICKKNIEESNFNSLDPCSVFLSSNINKDKLDQKTQTFFCHYECFRKVNNNDSVLYLKHMSTERELIEENKTIFTRLENYGNDLIKKLEQTNFYNKLFEFHYGTWIPLKLIIEGIEDIDDYLIKELNELEQLISDSILISWTEDYYANKRSKNVNWIVISLVSGNYEYPLSYLVSI